MCLLISIVTIGRSQGVGLRALLRHTSSLGPREGERGWITGVVGGTVADFFVRLGHM